MSRLKTDVGGPGSQVSEAGLRRRRERPGFRGMAHVAS